MSCPICDNLIFMHPAARPGHPMPIRIHEQDIEGREPLGMPVELSYFEDLLPICESQPCKTSCCSKCSDSCPTYRQLVIEKFPVGDPVTRRDGQGYYPVMGGFIPKKLVDELTSHLIDRLRTLNRTLTPTEKERLYWRVQELEDQRRELHQELLPPAGFDVMEVGPEACAYKLVMETFVALRVGKMGYS
ncbi:MAG: hypothetical protein PHC68_17640 [Syntrophorhabdaceae bacterium]|nr:hypothetical protein [Syntrophorhabdaceae bacterium]